MDISLKHIFKKYENRGFSINAKEGFFYKNQHIQHLGPLQQTDEEMDYSISKTHKKTIRQEDVKRTKR